MGEINTNLEIDSSKQSNLLSFFEKILYELKLKVININPLAIGGLIILKSFTVSQIISYSGLSEVTFKNIADYMVELLFIPHLAIVMFIVSFGFLFKDKLRTYFLLGIDTFISVLFILDLDYYRVTNDFLEFRHLLHPSLFNPLNHSLLNFKVYDLVFLLDIFLILFIIIFNKAKGFKSKRRIIYCPIIILLSIVTINKYHNIIDVKVETKNPDQFIYQNWYQRASINSESVLGYHFNDAFTTLNDERIKYKMRKQGVSDISEWLDDNKEKISDNEYKGIFEGKNLVFIQVESLDRMLINNTVNGQEVTPNLNNLLKNSFYFKNIYVQNGAGASSDSDFMVNTGVLPLEDIKTFFRYPDNKFTTISSLLEKKDYTTISSHPETRPFLSAFNWAENHTHLLNYDNVYDSSMLNADEEIYLGLSDKTYLKAVKEKLENAKQPFFNYSITLTSHGNYTVLPDQYKYLDLPEDLNKTILGCYFQNFRYTDEQIGQFISSIEDDENLKDTVFVIFGDHNGLKSDYKQEFYESGVSLNDTWWEDTENRIPLIVYSPGVQGKEIETYGGQIDIMPTIAYMMGADRSEFEDSVMGRVLVNTNRNATIQEQRSEDGDIVIKGETKDTAEEEHLRNSYNISSRYIKTDYLNMVDKN